MASHGIENWKCACNARDVPLQVIDLHVNYHYYTMCTLQDMYFNPKIGGLKVIGSCKTTQDASMDAVSLI